MNIVGHMIVRNEIDVIEETIAEAFRWIDTLVVLDGMSTDGTTELLRGLVSEYENVGKLLDVHVEADPDEEFKIDCRNRLLELTSPYEPDWVFSVDADEIYHVDLERGVTSPYAAIAVAHKQGANVVRSYVPQFWLTFEDLRRGALHEDVRDSIQVRRRWYSWGHMGTFAWKWNPDHFYPTDESKRTPELQGQTWRQWQRAGPLIPICKHYCIRTLEQGLIRAKERIERGGRLLFGKYAQNWLIDETIAGLHYLGDEGVWNVQENHSRLCQYLAWKQPAGGPT